MTQPEDIRARYYVASVFEGFEGADRVGQALFDAHVGIETVGDLLRLTILQIRHVMDKADIPEKDQIVFLSQMKASRLYPRGISSQEEFRLD